MRVTLNADSNCKQNFGMALYMPPKEKNAKRIGKYPAEQLEYARTSLENLASDVDIKIGTIKSKDSKFCGVTVQITKILDNPIKRLFYLGKQPKDEVRICEVGAVVNLPDCVLRKARNLKSEFIRYI